ncbi:MAG: metallophosphoesterase [Candidatus Thorarchaeota archaeon]
MTNTTIFHLSDIHVGEQGVNVGEFQRAVDELKGLAADTESPLVLITGDLTSDGLQEEYESFAAVVDSIDVPLLIVPGNHDERNYGTSHFEKLFGKRFKTYEDDTIALYAADSAEPDNDAGHVGRAKYPKIRGFFDNSEGKVRVFALHHHLVPVPHTGREHNVVEDAGDMLGLLDESGCSLVLNGHRHVPWMWRLNDVVHYTTGTLLSRRIRGATTQVYSVVEVSQEKVQFTLREREGTSKVFATCEIS